MVATKLGKQKDNLERYFIKAIPVSFMYPRANA